MVVSIWHSQRKVHRLGYIGEDDIILTLELISKNGSYMVTSGFPMSDVYSMLSEVRHGK